VNGPEATVIPAPVGSGLGLGAAPPSQKIRYRHRVLAMVLGGGRFRGMIFRLVPLVARSVAVASGSLPPMLARWAAKTSLDSSSDVVIAPGSGSDSALTPTCLIPCIRCTAGSTGVWGLGCPRPVRAAQARSQRASAFNSVGGRWYGV
jgi:hypothetical protein